MGFGNKIFLSYLDGKILLQHNITKNRKKRKNFSVLKLKKVRLSISLALVCFIIEATILSLAMLEYFHDIRTNVKMPLFSIMPSTFDDGILHAVT